MNGYGTAALDVNLKGPDGQPVPVAAVVTLLKLSNEVYQQETAKAGHVRFGSIAATEYSVQVVASGYETTIRKIETHNNEVKSLTIELQKLSAEDAAENLAYHALAPKAQKEIGKALELLRAQKAADARSHLDAANRAAPNQGEVQYLYGVYEKQTGNQEQAKSYWLKAVEYSPKHLLALLSLADALLSENRETEALPYAKRAVEVEPSSWRGHLVLANVYLRMGSADEAVKEAERALELGHRQATAVQPLLARALMEGGNKERAIKVLKEYVPEHPNDDAARRYLDSLQATEALVTAGKGEAAIEAKKSQWQETEKAISMPLPSDGLSAAGEGRDTDSPYEGDFSPIDPRAQEELNKAFELLRTNLTERGAEEARRYLDTAYRIAPTSAEVNYLFGAYWLQKYDRAKAISYWRKALDSSPKHYRTLLSLGQALLDQDKPGEALPYLELASKSEPFFSWRAYALSADAYLRQGFPDQAVKQAERALELGGEDAAVVRRYQAAALARLGEKDKAASVLQSYVKGHPLDKAAEKQLEFVEAQNAPGAGDNSSEELLRPGAINLVKAQPLPPSKWVPPDVDEKVPAVEPGAACALDTVVQKAGRRVEEFVKNVDRFTATEFLNHESISKWGFAKSEETRKFDYVVSIEEYRPGYFSVTEYRGTRYTPEQFPGGIATHGLPVLSLIFHPNNAGNFEMSCEGLAQWNGKPAWQVHFRQRPDKPNTIRAYRFAENGPSYPVALRGRAWIAADSYQVVRMETDLVAKLPEIRLLADHTLVDYGPVRFKNRNVEMWLPQVAEVYFDWKGQRVHRRHSFDNYMLFSVDERQKIAEPKQATQSPAQN